MAVFVFGSNLEGRHGRGAAKHAMQSHGAIYGQAEGRQGNSYAIPTKGLCLSLMSWEEIEPGIEKFCEYARNNPREEFHLTPVGCGLAGHRKRTLTKSLMRFSMPSNVFLTSTWITPT